MMQPEGPHGPAGTEAIPPATIPYGETEVAPEHVHLPALSVWPITAALGITIAAMGLVTTTAISVAGIVATLWAIASWIQELRHERHDSHGSH